MRSLLSSLGRLRSDDKIKTRLDSLMQVRGELMGKLRFTKGKQGGLGLSMVTVVLRKT